MKLRFVGAAILYILRTGGVTHVMSRAEIIPATNIGHINYCLNMHSFSDSFDTLTLHPQFGSTLAFQITHLEVL